MAGPMGLVGLALTAAAVTASSPRASSPYPKWDADCRGRNRTADPFDNITVMSWHIHYTGASTTSPYPYADFYNGFIAEFGPSATSGKNLFDGDTILCPFGPNYGSSAFEFVCSLEGPPDGGEQREREGGSPWGDLPQRAFFVPLHHDGPTWAWALTNQKGVAVIKHPNTGCMHDDHGLRAHWVMPNGSSAAHPIIQTLEFPCNKPGTGCQDFDYEGPPSCGCATPLHSDAPADSCKNCKVMGLPPPAGEPGQR